jgi:hypothetical protein
VALLSSRPDGSRPDIVVPFLAAVSTLGMLVFLLGIAVGTRAEHVPILVVAVVTGVVTLVPLILDQGRPAEKRHIFFSLLSLGWAAYYVQPVFTQYFRFGGYHPEQITSINGVSPPDLVIGQLVVLAAYLVMALGYASPFGRIVTSMLPAPRRDWPLASGLAVALVIIPLGWAVYLAGQFGLVPKRAGSGVLGTIASSTIYGIGLLMILHLRYKSHLAVLMLWVAIPLTMSFNFFTGSKGLFFAPLAMLVLTFVIVRRRFRMRWAVIAIVAFSLFYPVAQFYREVVLVSNTKKAADILTDPQAALGRVSAFAGTFNFGDYFGAGLTMTTARLAALGTTSIIIRDTPSRVPYQKGWTIGYIFLSYVPRVLWPAKPDISIGQWVTDHYGGGPEIRSNTGPSWIGELYFNFGLIGVVVGMFFLGVYFRTFHGVLFQPRVSIPGMLLAVILTRQIIPTMGGGLLGPVGSLPFYAGFVLILHLAVRSLGGTIAISGSSSRPRAAPVSVQVST